VAELHGARHLGEAFHPLARDQARVIAGAGCEHEHAVHVAEDLRRARAEKALGIDAAVDHAFHGVGHRARLLVDLLLHVMPVRAEVDGIGGEIGVMLDPLHRAALRIDHADAGALQGDHVAVVEVDDPARLRDERGDVGGEEVLAVAQADHQRAAHARAGHDLRIVERHHAEGVSAMQVRDRLARRLEEVARRAEVMVDEVRDHLGVGLRLEAVAERLQARALLLVVLDDAVVHHGDRIPGNVGMRVRLGDPAMGGPAGMGDAEDPLEFLGARRVLHLGHAPDAPHAADAAVEDRDAGGVVAAVLEPLQALREDRDDVTAGDGSDDSTHGMAREAKGAPFSHVCLRGPADGDSGKQDSPRPGDRGE
jgi:hypothetical protein